jgi:hypothetical protein
VRIVSLILALQHLLAFLGMDYILQNHLWASELNVDLIINIKICGVCVCMCIYVLVFGDMVSPMILSQLSQQS